MGFWDFFTGSPEKHERVSTLTPEQEKVFSQLLQSIQGQGAGGAFGDSADYFRNILNDNPELMQQFMAPELRRYNQETIPGLAEQFAGMGSGGLSSSGFRNAAVNAGTDLSERLGAIRANLKQGAAGGLMGLGQQGLQNVSQDVMTQPGTEGLLSNLAPAIGAGLGSFAGPAGTAFGSMAGNMFKSGFGSSSPYGNSQPMRRGY